MSSGGVLVSLGGDLAVAGQAPERGWPILVAENPLGERAESDRTVRLQRGGLATSSVVCRRWRRGNRNLHHIIDPRTGESARGRWRSATVAAPTCAYANAASTALVVGGEGALDVITGAGLSARLIGHDGTVRLIGAWPDNDGGDIVVPTVDRLASRVTALRGAP